jgi:hypothetical protein
MNRLLPNSPEYVGLSTETKPAGVFPGSTFFEYDTLNTYICYDGTNWTFYKSDFVLTGIVATTVDLHQSAGAKDLFTATAQDIWIRSLIFKLPNIDVSDDTGGITSIAIQTDDATPQVLLTSAQGALANLTAEKQFVCSTPILLPATKKIQLILAGGTADTEPTTCSVVAIYQSVVAGGSLAV